MAKNYFSMNEVPIGTKMIVKDTDKEVTLIRIQNFPTVFIVEDQEGVKNKYFTYQVNIIGWPPKD